MKIGTCISPKLFGASIPAADYIELPAREFYTMESEQFQTFYDNVKNGTLKTYACNCLTPITMRLTGPEVDMNELEEYAKIVFERLAQLNIRMLVFGAGKSKNVPEGFSREAAWDQLYEIGTMFANVAKQYDQMIAVEPLSYTETNIVNTIQEAADYVRTVNLPNFKYMVDFFHFDNNDDDPQVLMANKADLVHAHIAAPKTRQVPQSEEDFAFVRQSLELLKDLNYNGALSFEGRCQDPVLINDALISIKQLWGEM